MLGISGCQSYSVVINLVVVSQSFIMKRRKFLISSFSSVIFGSGYLQNSRVAVSFELKSTSIRPSQSKYILVSFDNIDIVPKYLDDSRPMSVSISLYVNDELKAQQKSDEINFNNGDNITSEDLSGVNFSEVSTDTFDNTGFIYGSVEIKINHPTVGEKEYLQSFTINKDSIVVDDFENSNTLSNYDVISANSSDFELRQDVVYQGNNSLGIQHNNSNPKQISASGLNYYPSRGDIIRANIYLTYKRLVGVILGFFNQEQGSLGKGHRVFLGREVTFESMSVSKIDPDGTDKRDQKDINLSNNNWYEIVVDTSGEKIDFSLYDADRSTGDLSFIDSVSITDSELSEGSLYVGAGVRDNDFGNYSYIDNIRVE